MSKFKIEFTLKQHTPIIHFQANQNGATLRATELKPKFDKFLLEKIEGLPCKTSANGHKFLDYKVKIEQDFSKSKNIDSKKSLFFGNMGSSEEKKYKHNPKIFRIIFLSFIPEIKEAIKNHFEAFLANTNFGTRQSKGYGSFYLDKRFNSSFIKAKKAYSFTTKNWERDIKVLYSFLRQGINRVNKDRKTVFYSKPAIFTYAKSKGWTWDKKVIKATYFQKELKKQQDKYTESDNCVNFDSDEQYLLRDLFGLSIEQTWMSYKKAIISKENNEIERFKSPITFKVVDNRVYFWVNNSIEKILNQEFKIQKNKSGNLKLKTPEEFNFDDFFEFTFNINLFNHIKSQYHNQSEFAILDRIFKDIRSNK